MKNENIEQKKDEKSEKKYPIILLLLYSLSLIMFILSGSFTIATILNTKETNMEKIKMGQVKMELIDNKDTNIKLVDAYPMKMEDANKLKPFKFKISNEGTLPVIYRLKLKDVKEEDVLKDLPNDKLSHNKINYSLIDSKTKKYIATGLISDLKDGIIITEKMLPRYSKYFDFRLWINQNASNEIGNKYYAGEIVLEIDEILK